MTRPRLALHKQGNRVSGNDVAALKPFRDRAISAVNIVNCSVHDAAIGEQCRSAAGKRVNCVARRRRAIRILRERGEL